jgi:uncharacterized damage-inducible protein DinB
MQPTIDDIKSELIKNSQQYRREFASLSFEKLNQSPGENRWSIGTIIDHIITTNNTYDDVFTKLIDGKYQAGFISKIPFLAGWIGNMIINSVKPGSAKMKTLPVFEPKKSSADAAIFDELDNSNRKIADYLDRLSSKNLLSKVIASPANDKLCYKVSDAFIIILEHERKHMAQALEVKNEIA